MSNSVGKQRSEVKGGLNLQIHAASLVAQKVEASNRLMPEAHKYPLSFVNQLALVLLAPMISAVILTRY